MTTENQCPRCGCDLEEAFEEKQRQVERVVEERHGEELRVPRRRAKIGAAVMGLLTAILVGVASAMVVLTVANSLGYQEEIDAIKLYDLSTYTWSRVLAFLLAATSVGIVCMLVLRSFWSDVTPPEEKRLWKEYEARYVPGGQFKLF